MENGPQRVPSGVGKRQQDGKPDLRIWLSQTLMDLVPRFVLDHTGHLLAANQAFADLFALPGPFLASSSELVPHHWPPFCLDGERFSHFFRKDPHAPGCLVTPHRFQEHSPCFALCWRPWQMVDGKILYQGWASAINSPTCAQPSLHFHNSHRLIFAILSCIPDPVFVKNESGVYSLINPAFSHRIGLPISAILGKTDFELMTAPIARQSMEIDQKVIHTHLTQEYEQQETDSDGQTRLYQIRKSPLLTTKGDLVGILGICRDVTELRKQAKSMQDIQIGAEHVLLEKAELLELASHDLKSPLSAMVEVLATLQKSLQMKAETKQTPSAEDMDMLEVSLGSTEHMLRLVSDLLQTYRIQHGKPAAQNGEVINLSALVKQVIDLNTPHARKKRIKLNTSYPEPCHLRADADRIREVLDNLVNNAIKFSKPRSEVSIDVEVTGDKVHLQVTDHGPGLTEEDQEKLFQRYTPLSAKPTGGESSTGLGLCITKKLVEQHSGRIWAENRPGEGAAFHVEWPAP